MVDVLRVGGGTCSVVQSTHVIAREDLCVLPPMCAVFRIVSVPLCPFLRASALMTWTDDMEWMISAHQR